MSVTGAVFSMKSPAYRKHFPNVYGRPLLSPYLEFQLDITHTKVHIRRCGRGDRQYGLEEIVGVNLGVDQ